MVEGARLGGSRGEEHSTPDFSCGGGGAGGVDGVVVAIFARAQRFLVLPTPRWPCDYLWGPQERGRVCHSPKTVVRKSKKRLRLTRGFMVHGVASPVDGAVISCVVMHDTVVRRTGAAEVREEAT